MSAMATQTYRCSYRYDGKFCVIELEATSFMDAQHKLRAIGNGQVDGVVVSSLWRWIRSQFV